MGVITFGDGYLQWDFTNWREIWFEASPIFQTGLLHFWES